MKPHTRPYYILILILGALTAFGPMSIDMYLPAMPSIAKDFGVDAARIELTLSAFVIGLCVGQFFYGPLADRFGRKKPLYVGILLYALASAGCAMSKTPEQLIFFRLIQALGGCAGSVIARAVVRDLFNHRDGAQVFSLLMLVMGLAPILAPFVGGYMLLIASWRTLFWILSGMSSLALLMVIFALPETHKPDPNVRMTRVFHTYFDIMKRRDFLGYALVCGLGASGMFAYVTSASFVLIDYFGVAPQHFGWIFGSNAIGLIGMAQVNAWLMRKSFHPEQILNACLHILAVAGSVLVIAAWLHAPMPLLLVPLFVFIGVMGAVFPNTMAGALQHEKKRAGAASALTGTFQYGIAVFSSIAISMSHAHSPLPMALAMGFAGISSLTVYLCFDLKNRSIKATQATELAPI